VERQHSVVGQIFAWEQGIVEPELGQVTNAARVQDPVEMVHFVLHDPGMKVLNGPINGHPAGIEAGVAQMPITRHEPAHAGHRQASFPAFILLLPERRQGGVDQHRKGHRIRLRVARIELEAEDDDAQAYPDLRCSEAGPIEIAHGVPHIGQQAVEFRSAKFEYRLSYRQKARIAHFENFAYCHGS
jgi:hypothetical protein